MWEKTMDPIKPGEVFAEESLLPLGISQNALARELNVPPRRTNEKVLGNAVLPLTSRFACRASSV